MSKQGEGQVLGRSGVCPTCGAEGQTLHTCGCRELGCGSCMEEVSPGSDVWSHKNVCLEESRRLQKQLILPKGPLFRGMWTKCVD